MMVRLMLKLSMRLGMPRNFWSSFAKIPVMPADATLGSKSVIFSCSLAGRIMSVWLLRLSSLLLKDCVSFTPMHLHTTVRNSNKALCSDADMEQRHKESPLAHSSLNCVHASILTSKQRSWQIFASLKWQQADYHAISMHSFSLQIQYVMSFGTERGAHWTVHKLC